MLEFVERLLHFTGYVLLLSERLHLIAYALLALGAGCGIARLITRARAAPAAE